MTWMAIISWIYSRSYNQNKIVWYEHKGGSIVGTVFDDLDSDGVQKVTHLKPSISTQTGEFRDGVSGTILDYNRASLVACRGVRGKFTAFQPMRLADEFDELLDFGKPIVASGSLGIAILVVRSWEYILFRSWNC